MLETVMKNLTVAITELTAELRTARSPSVDGATVTTPAPALDAQETPTPAPVAASEPAPSVTAAVDELVKPVTAAVEKLVEEATPVPTKKALVEKFIELAQTKDREVAVKLLADFGVSKLPELTDKNKWADFVAAVDALLAG